jgi:hypothetical protein
MDRRAIFVCDHGDHRGPSNVPACRQPRRARSRNRWRFVGPLRRAAWAVAFGETLETPEVSFVTRLAEG